MNRLSGLNTSLCEQFGPPIRPDNADLDPNLLTLSLSYSLNICVGNDVKQEVLKGYLSKFTLGQFL